MVLTVSDFPDGADLVSHTASPIAGLTSVAHTSAATNTFSGVSFHGVDGLSVVSSALLAKKTSDAAKLMSTIAQATKSKAGKGEFLAAVKEVFAAVNKAKVTSAVLLRTRILHVPDEAVDLAVALKYSGTTIDVGELWLARGAALSFVTYSSKPGFTAGDATALAGVLDKHLQIALATTAPANSVAPSISGTPQIGQSLTALNGSWAGKALFTVQWLRCDASGAGCVAISGATDPQYIVVAADVGSTLAIEVTAANGAGTTAVQSPPAGPVS